MNLKWILLPVFFLTSVVIADPRLWPGVGHPLRQANFVEFWSEKTVATDSLGNVIVVWTDQRTGSNDVYAQLLDFTAIPQWASGGITVCAEPHSQYNPEVVATTGGYIVVWIDYRSDNIGSGDIRAQKISRLGQRLWNNIDSTGVPVDLMIEPVRPLLGLISDGAGGALIAWGIGESDSAVGIRVQHIGSNGNLIFPATMHLFDGIVTSVPMICDDGSHNLLIAWTSIAQSQAVIRVTKMSPAGEVMWGDSGSVAFTICNAYSHPQLCADGSGGCFVFCDTDNHENRVQHLDANGIPQWGSNGNLVPVPPYDFAGLDLTTSYNQGVVDGLFVSTLISVSSDSEPTYAQKLSLAGEPLWGTTGQIVCHTRRWVSGCKLASDSLGGLVLSRFDGDGDTIPSGLKLTRLNAEGLSLWADCEPRVFFGSYVFPELRPIVHTQSGCITVIGQVHKELEHGPLIYQAMEFSSGVRILGDSGVVLQPDEAGAVYSSGVATLSPGRFFIHWMFHQDAVTYPVYQILRTDRTEERVHAGQPILEPDTTVNEDLLYVNAVCTDSELGAFILLNKGGFTNPSSVRLTRISQQGERVGLPEGVTVTQNTGQDIIQCYCLISDTSTGCYVGWYARNTASTVWRTLVQRYNSDLTQLWQQPLMIDSTYLLKLLPGNANSCLIFTRDLNDQGLQLYNVRKINFQTELLWQRVIPDSCLGSNVVADGSGGFYWAWTDRRFSAENGPDVFAQHYDGEGQALWMPGGITVLHDNYPQYLESMTVDREHNLYLGWRTYKSTDNTNDIFVQRIRPDGSLCWGDSGRALTTNSRLSSNLKLAIDAHDHLTAVWIKDSQSSNRPQYLMGMQYDSAGVATDSYWIPSNGSLVADSLSKIDEPSMAAETNGGVLVTYTRSPKGGGQFDSGRAIYAQLIADEPLIPSRVGVRALLPQNLTLYPCVPNPFNLTTMISYYLPSRAQVSLDVFDITGRLTTTLTHSMMEAGKQTAYFDATNFASGVYFCRLRASGLQRTMKMVLLK